MRHRLGIDVRWSDLDPYRHLNHAAYLSYCESARIDALDTVGFGMKRLTELGWQIVIVAIEAKFVAPALEGMRVEVETEVVQLGRVRSTWHQRMTHGEDLLFEANVTAAFTDLAGRPRRGPEGFVEAFS